eukprot:1140472-Pelagomonas_calceolata.AAC.1
MSSYVFNGTPGWMISVEYKKQTRRARHAYERYQKEVFLDRLKRHRPDIHEMLRNAKETQEHPSDSYYSRRLELLPTTSFWCPCLAGCPESTHSQEAALHTNRSVGGHPTCPAGSVPHIPHQQASPMGSYPESTLCRRPGLWDSTSRGVESVLGAVRSVAQRVAARWTGNSGAPSQDMTVPLRRNNLPPEHLFRQGAEFPWMPEPNVMELPDAAALYPIDCEHTH